MAQAGLGRKISPARWMRSGSGFPGEGLGDSLLGTLNPRLNEAVANCAAGVAIDQESFPPSCSSEQSEEHPCPLVFNLQHFTPVHISLHHHTILGNTAHPSLGQQEDTGSQPPCPSLGTDTGSQPPLSPSNQHSAG